MGQTFQALGWVPYLIPALLTLVMGKKWHWPMQGLILFYSIVAVKSIDNAMAPLPFALMFLGSLAFGIVALFIRRFI